MGKTSRKRYSISKKLEVLRLVRNNKNLDKTARETGINRRVIQRWQKEKQTLLALATTSAGGKKKRINKDKAAMGKFPELEKEVVKFIQQKGEQK